MTSIASAQHHCSTCGSQFPSKNKLFQHLTTIPSFLSSSSSSSSSSTSTDISSTNDSEEKKKKWLCPSVYIDTVYRERRARNLSIDNFLELHPKNDVCIYVIGGRYVVCLYSRISDVSMCDWK